MIVLTKNKPNLFIIDSKNAKEFVENFNKNVISEELLKECKKITGLFQRVK